MRPSDRSLVRPVFEGKISVNLIISTDVHEPSDPKTNELSDAEKIG